MELRGFSVSHSCYSSEEHRWNVLSQLLAVFVSSHFQLIFWQWEALQNTLFSTDKSASFLSRHEKGSPRETSFCFPLWDIRETLCKKKKKKISFIQMQTLPMSILPLRYFSSYSNILGTCILFFMEAEREKYSFEIMKDNQKRIIKLLFLLSWNS
jgi:hypothetical protein